MNAIARFGRFGVIIGIAVGLLGFITLPQAALAVVPVVKTVPVDPSNPSAPHTACNSVAITLKGTSDQQGANFSFDWDPGDGSAHTTGIVTNQYDVAATHTYAGVNNQTWTAVLKITDTNTGDNASANFPVVLVNPCSLNAHVNIAIDEGLWYLHKIEWRRTSGATAGSVGAIPIGGWDIRPGSPGTCVGTGAFFGVSGAAAGCDNWNGRGVVDADNIQAFEVSGHQGNGPASDPYSDDVQRALNRMFQFLDALPVAPVTYTFNAPPACPVAPCTFTYDGNANGQLILGEDEARNDPGHAGYMTGQYLDALVATANPAGVAATGPAGVLGHTFKDIAQDMEDAGGYCQYPAFPGGSWWYNCPDGGGLFVDNSAAQWDAIGLIGAARAFGLTSAVNLTTPIGQIQSANNVWISNSQAADGSFGYRSSSPIWGPFATTPSGMVQMDLDLVGRGDMRWNRAEAFYRDTFCNNPNGFGGGNFFSNAVAAPKAYTYGMFSFTKSMLLHDPGGPLAAITNLHDSVSATPPPDIDWYAAELVPYDNTPPNGVHGGVSGQCDGVARSLVDRQGLDEGYPPTPAAPTNGWWLGHSTVANHFPFETAWSIIMLRRTVFVRCVDNLYGRGTASGTAPARIDLTWTGIPNVDHYEVFRGTSSGNETLDLGSTTITAFKDTNGLTNGDTYYYILKPRDAAGNDICTSNERKVTIPAAGR